MSPCPFGSSHDSCTLSYIIAAAEMFKSLLPQKKKVPEQHVERRAFVTMMSAVTVNCVFISC